MRSKEASFLYRDEWQTKHRVIPDKQGEIRIHLDWCKQGIRYEMYERFFHATDEKKEIEDFCNQKWGFSKTVCQNEKGGIIVGQSTGVWYFALYDDAIERATKQCLDWKFESAKNWMGFEGVNAVLDRLTGYPYNHAQDFSMTELEDGLKRHKGVTPVDWVVLTEELFDCMNDQLARMIVEESCTKIYRLPDKVGADLLNESVLLGTLKHGVDSR